MPVLDNPRHEAFCQAVASLTGAGEAYSKCYPKATKATCETSGPALLRKPHISSRVAEIQSKKAEDAGITKAELIGILVDSLRAAPVSASLVNPLCELRMSKLGPFAAYMGKSQIVDQLCKLFGWYAPAKLEHSGQVDHHITVTEAERTQLMDRRRQIREKILEPDSIKRSDAVGHS